MKYVLALMIIAAAIYLAAPLFYDRSVDESFPAAPEDSVGDFDLDTVMQMRPEEREAKRSHIMAAAAAQPDKMMSEGMKDDAPAVVASGSFVDADSVHRGSGNATLYALPGGEHLVRLEDLDVTNGPDLVVYLAKANNPKTAAEVTDGGFLSLGKLKGNMGNQNYPVPNGTDVSQYGSVVVWCELFGVLFSPASFSG